MTSTDTITAVRTWNVAPRSGKRTAKLTVVLPDRTYVQGGKIAERAVAMVVGHVAPENQASGDTDWVVMGLRSNLAAARGEAANATTPKGARAVEGLGAFYDRGIVVEVTEG